MTRRFWGGTRQIVWCSFWFGSPTQVGVSILKAKTVGLLACLEPLSAPFLDRRCGLPPAPCGLVWGSLNKKSSQPGKRNNIYIYICICIYIYIYVYVYVLDKYANLYVYIRPVHILMYTTCAVLFNRRSTRAALLEKRFAALTRDRGVRLSLAITAPIC